jgi:MFS family permease
MAPSPLEKENNYSVEAESDHGIGTIEPLEEQINREFYGASISDSYRMKSEIVSKCMDEIGMGRYQWCLFVVTGFGWITDNFWSQSIGAIQPAVALEFTDVSRVTVSSIAYYAGMIFGASFWGISCDFTGRKLAFNMTILIGAIFGTAVAGFDNFGGFCFMWAIIGTAAGGNVPVDSMIFLEFVPGSHQYLVTALSAWWNLGQVIVSLVAWVFLANFSCPTDAEVCRKADNMGWRYTMITLGAMALAFALIRILVFKMPESPRFLLSKGRDQEAVDAVNYVARCNKTPEPLTLAMLQEVDSQLGIVTNLEGGQTMKLSKKEVLRDNLRDFKPMNYKALFQTRKLGQQTAILWFIWLTIGIAYPLFFNFLPTYLAQRFPSGSLDTTYRNYCIVSAVGVVGPVSASFLVQTKLGRRYCMGISAIITGAFLFGYTAAQSRTMDLAFNCVSSMLANFQYAIMFAITPESFPGPHRGLGTGQAATNLRFGSLVAALIGTYTGFSVVPIYVSASMWIFVGFVTFGLPFETAGHSAI